MTAAVLRSNRALSLAGFQVTAIGRFWVTAEGLRQVLATNEELARRVAQHTLSFFRCGTF